MENSAENDSNSSVSCSTDSSLCLALTDGEVTDRNAGNGNGNSGNDNGNGNSGNNGNGNDNGNSNGFSLPEPSAEAYDIAWGKWNNPIDNNWVVVQQLEDELVQISTSNYFAELNTAPVANLRGNHSYTTGIASSFIGSGNVGDVDSLLAAMDVDFDNGTISHGSLEILSGGQSWTVGFDGLVNKGQVDLNMNNGQLMDASGVISNSIGGDLGGVFTGIKGEAFVGGFDLIDEINTLNRVDGLYTIER